MLCFIASMLSFIAFMLSHHGHADIYIYIYIYKVKIYININTSTQHDLYCHVMSQAIAVMLTYCAKEELCAAALGLYITIASSSSAVTAFVHACEVRDLIQSMRSPYWGRLRAGQSEAGRGAYSPWDFWEVSDPVAHTFHHLLLVSPYLTGGMGGADRDYPARFLGSFNNALLPGLACPYFQ